VRLIFCGTPEFARTALERLHAHGHTIALVLTQPDRPAGRGMKLHASPVKQFALDHAIDLAQPRSLRLGGKYPQDAASARQAIADARADAMVVAAYGLILPQWVLDAMRQGPSQFGCINIHGSLLPRWRGAAPIHRAIEAGDTHTGITIMQMDAGLDTGDVLLMEEVPISPIETTANLHDRLAALGADMVVRALDLAATGELPAHPQAVDGVTYAQKIEKHEAAIDWTQDAASIVRRVRAFNPFPGATMVLQGETIKVWATAPGPHRHGAEAPYPGTVVSLTADGIGVAAMDSVVLLTELQRPGGKRLAAADFVRGFDLRVGMQATPAL
jgi:methionyl-tRNA formyltransferase